MIAFCAKNQRKAKSNEKIETLVSRLVRQFATYEHHILKCFFEKVYP